MGQKRAREEINFSRSQMGEELGDFNAPIHLQSIGIQSVEQIERKGMSSSSNEMVQYTHSMLQSNEISHFLFSLASTLSYSFPIKLKCRARDYYVRRVR